jgi:hypothetical protein
MKKIYFIVFVITFSLVNKFHSLDTQLFFQAN